MSAEKRSTFMLLVAVGFMLFSIIWALAPYENINLPAKFLIDFLDWPLDKTSVALDKNTMWLSSVGAGLLAAFAIVLGGIVAPAIKKGNQSIIRITVVAIVAWYLIDSIGSIASGVASNAVFNTIFLILVLIPLWGGCRKK